VIDWPTALVGAIIAGLVGILNWFGTRKAYKRIGDISEEQTGLQRRMTELEERGEQRAAAREAADRIHVREVLMARLMSIKTWIGDLPDSPKHGAWNHDPRAPEELTDLDELVRRGGLTSSSTNVLEHVTELRSGVRGLNAAIEEAKDRQSGHRSRGYNAKEVEKWRYDRAAVSRALGTLLGVVG